MVECGWELLKSICVCGWLDHVLVVDKSSHIEQDQDMVGLKSFWCSHASYLRQVEAYLKDIGMTGLASVWAMARRRPI